MQWMLCLEHERTGQLNESTPAEFVSFLPWATTLCPVSCCRFDPEPILIRATTATAMLNPHRAVRRERLALVNSWMCRVDGTADGGSQSFRTHPCPLNG